MNACGWCGSLNFSSILSCRMSLVPKIHTETARRNRLFVRFIWKRSKNTNNNIKKTKRKRRNNWRPTRTECKISGPLSAAEIVRKYLLWVNISLSLPLPLGALFFILIFIYKMTKMQCAYLLLDSIRGLVHSAFRDACERVDMKRWNRFVKHTWFKYNFEVKKANMCNATSSTTTTTISLLSTLSPVSLAATAKMMVMRMMKNKKKTRKQKQSKKTTRKTNKVRTRWRERRRQKDTREKNFCFHLAAHTLHADTEYSGAIRVDRLREQCCGFPSVFLRRDLRWNERLHSCQWVRNGGKC